jgi:hypothetical protein
MTQEHKIGCMACKHINFDGGCAAFPAEIPMYFADGQIEHTTPIAGQENDIVFEWIDRIEQRARMKKIIADRKAVKALPQLAQ